ncbi:NAD(P)-binding protein [Xylariomycetidae sp. FL2044]|nr:NAD(P)-binding protein [Xylariomycetidae sp. FL2044]
MVKVFVTGVTGYLGGDFVATLLKVHPEYEVTCLVREKVKGSKVVEAHPMVKIVYGDLDDDNLLQKEGSKADIICNFANATHEPSAKALAIGLSRRTASGPGFFIHVMGSGTMIYDDVVNNRYGQGTDRVYNDLEGLSEVLSVPDFAKARGAENAVRNAGIQDPERVKTAIVSTGSVYGVGRGIQSYRQTAIHQLARCTLQKGHGIKVGQGKAAWPHVHIRDFTDLYLRLVEHAVSNKGEEGESGIWGGSGGFYFAENGEHVWGVLAEWFSKEAVSRGFLASDKVVAIEPAEAANLTPMGQFFWGCNARVRGRRARELLGWQPSGSTLQDEVKSIIDAEATSLGLSA